MRVFDLNSMIAMACSALVFFHLPSKALAADPEPPRRESGTGAVFVEDGYVRFLLGSAYTPGRGLDGERAFRPQGDRLKTSAFVSYRTAESAGTIVIETADHRLYLVLGGGRAIRYSVGVGRQGYGWQGVETITRKAEWPAWIPTDELRRLRPNLPRRVAGGAENPLGARALYLGSTLFRIHGTNEPSTVGSDVSSGCFRMMNADIIDLYRRVDIGAKVVVR